MARAIWTGAISFGLVNIPVQLYTAVKDRDIHFHQICKRDKSRVRQRLVCEGDQDEVDRRQLLKGFEIAPDQYVVFEKDELEQLAPEKSSAIEVLDFVDIEKIDPVYYEKPYYLAPKNAAKPYKLLLEAMKDSGKIAIAKFVMRDKEYLAALRPLENVICLELMHFADEVVEAESLGDIEAVNRKVKINKAELDMAKQLIDTLYTDFKPENYRNEYRQRVQHAIDAKAQGQQVVTGPSTAPEATKVADLMSTLEHSLEQAKKRKQPA